MLKQFKKTDTKKHMQFKIYKYMGWLIESNRFGYFELKKDYSPKKRTSKKFIEVIKDFEELKNKDDYLIY